MEGTSEKSEASGKPMEATSENPKRLGSRWKTIPKSRKPRGSRWTVVPKIRNAGERVGRHIRKLGSLGETDGRSFRKLGSVGEGEAQRLGKQEVNKYSKEHVSTSCEMNLYSPRQSQEWKPMRLLWLIPFLFILTACHQKQARLAEGGGADGGLHVKPPAAGCGCISAPLLFSASSRS